MTVAPLAVALDAADLETAVRWAGDTRGHVRACKVGLELFLRYGHDAVSRIRAASGGREIFLDLKLHDIPNTVAGAARSVAGLSPQYLTVHASGGRAMVEAAVAELPATSVVGVTLLTSLSEADLDRLGWTGTPRDVVLRLAATAVEGGAQALVCSPLEVAAVRREVGPAVTLITPGVRPARPAEPAATPADDQARVATPEQALADGADLLVIGRPITGALDPGEAAARIAASLNGR